MRPGIYSLGPWDLLILVYFLFFKSPLSNLTWLNWAQLELSLAQLSPSLFTLLWKYFENIYPNWAFFYPKCIKFELVWYTGITADRRNDYKCHAP